MSTAHLATRSVTVPFAERPYNLFVIAIGRRRFFGWKEPVAFHRNDPVPATRSTFVAFADIVGEVLAIETTDAGYRLTFTPTDPDDVAALVCADPARAELVYPLRRLIDGAETVQTAEYWNDRAADPDSLDDDEVHLRAASAALLAPLLQDGDLVFDPACSTGRFLAEIGKHAPCCRLRGQELSPQMVSLARCRVPDVRHGSAEDPACADGEAKVVICRFLNLDVVTSQQARSLFDRLSRCLGAGGYMLVVGHTPILLDAGAMRANGFHLHQTIMLTPDQHALCQFYLLQKPA